MYLNQYSTDFFRIPTHATCSPSIPALPFHRPSICAFSQETLSPLPPLNLPSSDPPPMTSSRGQIHSTEIEACSSCRQLYLSRKLACANGWLHVCLGGKYKGMAQEWVHRFSQPEIPTRGAPLFRCSVRENARPNSHTTTTLPTGVASTASSRRSHRAGLHLHRLIRNSAQ